MTIIAEAAWSAFAPGAGISVKILIRSMREPISWKRNISIPCWPLLSESSSRVSFKTFLEDVEGFLKLIYFKYICYTGVVLAHSRSLVE